MTTYLIYCDQQDAYFSRLRGYVAPDNRARVNYWVVGTRDQAKEFPTRAAAVRTLHDAGNHRHGWRVLVEKGGAA